MRLARALVRIRSTASWIDGRAPVLALLLAAVLPLPVGWLAAASPVFATALFSLLPLTVAWSVVGYVRDARRGIDRPLVEFLRSHGHRAWIYSLAGFLVAGSIFAVLHGIGGGMGWFGRLLGGLAVTIQSWCILGEGFLILTAVLHATRRMRASVGSVGVILLTLGLVHVAVAGIVILSDPSADDILLYAAPAAAILLFAGGLLLVVGQLIASRATQNASPERRSTGNTDAK